MVVIGGGIAGLAAAWGLVRTGSFQVRLFEREDQLFAHSSGRNAAIYRSVEKQLPVARLGVRAAELLDEVVGSRAGWLAADGLLLTAREPKSLEGLALIAGQVGIDFDWLTRDELTRAAPITRDGHANAALFVPSGGVLDPHAIMTALRSAVRSRGTVIELEKPVRRILVRAGRAVGVELEPGVTVEADRVVIAGGAWAKGLGESCGAPLPLGPVRRHLVMLDPEQRLEAHAPTVWDAELEAYFRPESGAVLASPGDATPWHPELPAPDPNVLETLWDKLRAMAPPLARARVRRSWACLRTFAPDKVSVVGPDPRVADLYWLAGLGGHGLTAGVAAGEVLAATLSGADHPLSAVLSPARFC